MEQLSGSIIKGYELRDRIGAGGFGAVYRAYQSTVGREVAVKIILPGYANRPEFVRRFEAEAQTVARLEHMNITPLYDYWRDPEGAYLVMRYLRGGNLQTALRDDPYDLETAARLLDQVASALAVAHRSHVIHRDIKPANILLDEDGNGYVADFGLAKDLDNGAIAHTQAGDVVGTPDYLSPEQVRNEPVTPKSDIYSLGLVLYEMLTGSHPFPELLPVERMFKHLNEPVPKIASLDQNVADAINEVVQQADRTPDAA
jgi:serine/threonine protein kinase